MKKLVLVVSIVIGLSVPWAGAARTNVADPNDTAGLMDVRKVRLDPGKQPRWKFVTFSRWSTARIWDRGFAIVNIDSFGTARPDYYAIVRSDGYGLIAELWRDRSKKDDFKVSSLKVWRKNQRSLVVKVPLSRMKTSDTRPFYRWVAKTVMIGANCPRTCIDRIPNKGLEMQLLPGVDPSPEPTPTPTPTPTVEPTPTPTVEPSPTASP